MEMRMIYFLKKILYIYVYEVSYYINIGYKNTSVFTLYIKFAKHVFEKKKKKVSLKYADLKAS